MDGEEWKVCSGSLADLLDWALLKRAELAEKPGSGELSVRSGGQLVVLQISCPLCLKFGKTVIS